MTAFRQAIIPLQLRGSQGEIEDLQAVIDTGFTDALTVPPALAAKLQLPFHMTRAYELGDGSEVEFDIHKATIIWDGRDTEVEALLTEGGLLVGMSLLMGYSLFMDGIDGGEVRIEARS